ncbi:MAG: hypothetical protein ABIG95_04435 [Candidatus Woesearchaeota archaeon]
MWVAIDWSRMIVSQLTDKQIKFGANTLLKLAISFVIFIYGLIIIIEGIRAKKYIRYIGRIREVTYVLVIFTPIIYGVVDLNLQIIIAMALFFPLFYYVIELIDKLLPDSPAIMQDEGQVNTQFVPKSPNQKKLI